MSANIERIISDQKICSGKPCVKGTRIPVHIVLDLLAAGEDFDGIKKAYPNITRGDCNCGGKRTEIMLATK